MDKSQINSVLWYKNDILIEEKLVRNAHLDVQNMKLTINNLSHTSDNAIYHCSIELKNRQNISSNKIEIETKCKF